MIELFLGYYELYKMSYKYETNTECTEMRVEYGAEGTERGVF